MLEPRLVHEENVEEEGFADRRSKALVGGEDVPTAAGFSLGVAEYFAEEFGELQTHSDQEAVYVISGQGEMRVGEHVVAVRPGFAAYLPPGTPHATRRTGREPVKVVYAHGAV